MKKNIYLILIPLFIKLGILGFLFFNIHSIISPMMTNSLYQTKTGIIKSAEVSKTSDDLIGNVYKINLNIKDDNGIEYNIISSNQDRHTAEAFRNSVDKEAKVGIYNKIIDYVNVEYNEKTLKETNYQIDSDKLKNIRAKNFLKILELIAISALILSTI